MDNKAETVIKKQITLQRRFEEGGITGREIACAAVLILDNIAKGYPTADLITAYPFDVAYQYLASANLVTGNKSSLRMTEAGSHVYYLEPRKIYFVQ